MNQETSMTYCHNVNFCFYCFLCQKQLIVFTTTTNRVLSVVQRVILVVHNAMFNFQQASVVDFPTPCWVVSITTEYKHIISLSVCSVIPQALHKHTYSLCFFTFEVRQKLQQWWYIYVFFVEVYASVRVIYIRQLQLTKGVAHHIRCQRQQPRLSFLIAAYTLYGSGLGVCPGMHGDNYFTSQIFAACANVDIVNQYIFSV